VSSRTARATQRNPVSKTTKQNNNNNNNNNNNKKKKKNQNSNYLGSRVWEVANLALES
jgi:hypothetical protein